MGFLIPSNPAMETHANVIVLPASCENNDAPAITCTSTTGSTPAITVSYAKLAALTRSLQAELANTGVTRASRVILIMPNGPEFVAVLLAIIRQRGTAAPLNPQFTKDEFRGLFTRIEPELLVMQAPRSGDTVELLAHPGFQAARDLGIRVALCHRETAGEHNGTSNRVALGLANKYTNGFSNGKIKGVSSGVNHGVPNGACNRASHKMSNGQSSTTDKVQGELRLTLRLFEDGNASLAFPSTRAPVFSRDEVWSEDKALVLSTSGTTGVPRAIPLSHTNLLVAIRSIITNHQLSPADKTFIISPLYYVVGICGSLLATLFSGGCAVIPESLPDTFWQDCAEHGITWFYATPHTHHRLFGLPFPNDRVPSQLRFVRSGGNEMPPDLYERLVALGLPLLESYGMTETGPAILCNYLMKDNGPGKKRRGHYPIPDGVDVKILPCDSSCNSAAVVDDKDPASRLTNEPGVIGEVCLRAKNIMSGYINDPRANVEAFLSNDYFRTGDLGSIQPDGYLKLLGRIKEIICKQGGKVCPAEIEHVAMSHHSVAGAACFRIADIYGDDDIGLAITLRPPAEAGPPARADLRRHIRGQLIEFKIPKEIVFVDAIPYNKTGKPLRTRLSQEFARGLLV